MNVTGSTAIKPEFRNPETPAHKCLHIILTFKYCVNITAFSQIKNPHGPDAGFLFAAVSKGEGEGWEFAK
jgi:hypothetical protein